MNESESEWEENLQDYNAQEVRDLFRVFPIPRGMKYNPSRPSEIDGVELHEWAATATGLDRELEFKKNYRGGNFGCSTTNIVVLDLDMKNGANGVGEWQRWMKEAGCKETLKTWTSKTPNNGYHLFFKLTPSQLDRYRSRLGPRTSMGSEGSGLDVRAGKSHVLLPGSRTKDGSYTWSEVRNPWDTELMTCPGWLIKKICGVSRLEQAFKRSPGEARKKRSPKEMPKLGQGERNGGLLKASSIWFFETRGDVMTGKITEADAKDYVWERLLVYNEEGTGGKPVSPGELKTIFRSAIRMESRSWDKVMSSRETKKAVAAALGEFPGAKVEEVITTQ